MADLSDIPTLNDAELLKHLEVRYAHDFIHCYCGPTLLIVNPYKHVQLEESEELRQSIIRQLLDNRLQDAVPHIWTMSALAWHNVFTTGQNQAICIQGESGAGKTEGTKRCLEFIAQLKAESRSLSRVPVEQKIISCNPLMECFGNAKTFRNDNSSRFGKYTTLYIDKEKKQVKGASIESYLLEKSRVTNLGSDERSFHIFYAMCRHLDRPTREKLFLCDSQGQCDMRRFNYLSQSQLYETPRINDKEFLQEVQRAFEDLDFAQETRDACWRILSAVLHLGNLKVETSDYIEGSRACCVAKTEDWQQLCSLMEFDKAKFEEALTNK